MYYRFAVSLDTKEPPDFYDGEVAIGRHAALVERYAYTGVTDSDTL